MFKRFAVATAVALVGTAAAQTVTVDLVSSVDGTTIAPGATVDWQIDFSVSSGDNAGLALLIADLNQDAGNPETLDLPPASGVPGAMSNFSRPDGISNPGEGTPTTGYPGVQRGTPGALNLVQIGGAQNTINQFFAPKPVGVVVTSDQCERSLCIQDHPHPGCLGKGNRTCPRGVSSGAERKVTSIALKASAVCSAARVSVLVGKTPLVQWTVPRGSSRIETSVGGELTVCRKSRSVCESV